MNTEHNMSVSIPEMLQRLENKLNENKWYKPILDQMEKFTNIRKVYLVVAMSISTFLTLLFCCGVQLVWGLIGFLYPAFKTITALEKDLSTEYKKWLKYWLVVTTLGFGETFLFLKWIPAYAFIKCVFFAWCYAPLPVNGSDTVYDFIIKPFFDNNEEALNHTFHQVARSAHTIYTAVEESNSKVLRSRKHPS